MNGDLGEGVDFNWLGELNNLSVMAFAKNRFARPARARSQFQLVSKDVMSLRETLEAFEAHLLTKAEAVEQAGLDSIQELKAWVRPGWAICGEKGKSSQD